MQEVGSTMKESHRIGIIGGRWALAGLAGLVFALGCLLWGAASLRLRRHWRRRRQPPRPRRLRQPPRQVGRRGRGHKRGGRTVARYLVGEQLASLSVPKRRRRGDVRRYGRDSVRLGRHGGRRRFDDRRWSVRLHERRIAPRQVRPAAGCSTLASSQRRACSNRSGGLPWPLPNSGEATFQIVGDLTIQEVTERVTWDAMAQFGDDSVSGRANTVVTFEQLDLSKRRSASSSAWRTRYVWSWTSARPWNGTSAFAAFTRLILVDAPKGEFYTVSQPR